VDPLPFGDVPNDCLRPLAEAVADEEWIKAETLAVEVGVLRRARVRQVLNIVSP